MNIFDKMERMSGSFSKTEMRFYKFAMRNVDYVARNSASIVAQDHDFSLASLTRFAKHLGYKGYAEFVFEFQRDMINSTGSDDERSTADLYGEVFAELDKQYPKERLKEIGSILYKASTVYTSGYHLSRTPAELLDMNLATFRYRSDFLPADKIFKINAFARKTDVVVLFSVTTASFMELVKALNNMGEEKPTIILFTQSKKHPIRTKVDYCYVLPNEDDIGSDHYLDPYTIYSYFISKLCGCLKAKE